MFGQVWKWAGKQRTAVTTIGDTPGIISLRMAELCSEVISWSTEPVELTFLERSAIIHHRLVKIHPFENGNGRFSRLVADRCLLGWKCMHPIWPNDLYRNGATRKRYILSLQEADKGNYESLISFMKDFGATDPSLSVIFQNNSYKFYFEGQKGIALIKALLRNGADPNQYHMLHVIINAKSSSMKKLEILKMFVERGVEIDRVDRNGLTAFQLAVSLGNRELAFYLKSKGAKPIPPPGLGYTKYYEIFQ